MPRNKKSRKRHGSLYGAQDQEPDWPARCFVIMTITRRASRGVQLSEWTIFGSALPFALEGSSEEECVCPHVKAWPLHRMTRTG